MNTFSRRQFIAGVGGLGIGAFPTGCNSGEVSQEAAYPFGLDRGVGMNSNIHKEWDGERL
jgi:hypothetical protein